LIRDGVALEKAGRVTAVLFDKTGTLTVGRPEVVEVWEQGEIRKPKAEDRKKSEGPKTESLESAVRLAAALASNSGHPISQAIAQLSPNGLPLSGWQEVRGAGVQANVESQHSSTPAPQHPPVTARLGSVRWLQDSGVDLAPGQAFIAEWASQGATVVGLAVEQSLRAVFAVKDAVKPGARAVVEQLGRQGLEIYLVTGDNALTAGSIAKQTGIKPENVFAQVRPEQKAEFVKKLQQQGQRVAFVGDGINDAPALEQADLGVAVSRASDVAREAADIILLKSEIEAVPESLGLARATLRTIKQNLFWAFFYNAIGVPLAALGFMSPILCAAAMGLSDLVVIGNALRLRRWRA
jgi:Cu+-exporting ATPase